MCGIIGGVNVSNQWVLDGLQHQKMRGPDNTGIQTIGNVTFGHNRLSIIDLSERSSQPITDMREKYMMVYNGEWYNYKEFWSLNSDSLTLFILFSAYEFNEALQYVNGMFAIAYYCRTHKIHLAVDRFGQKPLYYYHEGDVFAFASTPAALYGLLPKWELDRDALQSYWLLGSVMGENGLFKGIKKLCASEHLTYDLLSNKVTIERYWEPKFQENTDGIEDMVLEAIKKVKVSDVPIHIFLSGGIDSTLVASQFEGGSAIHLDGPEVEYAKFAAEKFNIDLKIVTPDDTDTEEALMDYSLKCGEPTMAGIIPWMVARETAKYGKVAISANGADELFFGYDRTSRDYLYQTSQIFRRSLFNNLSYPNHFLKKDEGFWLNFCPRSTELSTYVQYDLNKTLDFASMCHGLEVRNPFLDHNLVEMALSIPEKIHRQNGNKTILKNMLRKMGFAEGFLNRPKQGFSLFKQPKNLDICMETAWRWVQQEGYLDIQGRTLTDRDEKYLKMSALGFYYWYKVFKHKIENE